MNCLLTPGEFKDAVKHHDNFQVKLLRAMNLAGINQTQLAAKMDRGKSYVSNLLANRYDKPHRETLNRICDALNLSRDYFD